MLRHTYRTGCSQSAKWHVLHGPPTFCAKPLRFGTAESKDVLPSLHRCIHSAARLQCLASNQPTSKVPWLSTIRKVEKTTDQSCSPDQLPTDLDAIILLAGGLTETGECPPWVTRRLDTAASVWKLQASPNCPIVCLGGGTPHKPPVLKQDGYVLHESTSCASYLMKQGVPPTSILKETSSYDTVGNAFFALTIHAIPAGWRRVAVVTSEFHMPRTQALVTTMWDLAAKHVLNDPNRYTFWFASSTDEGLWPQDVLDIRKEKEMAAVRNWLKASAGFTSFADVHTWLYATHQCYSVSRQHEETKQTITDPRLLASY